MTSADQEDALNKRELLAHGLLTCEVQPSAKRAAGTPFNTNVMTFGGGYNGQLGSVELAKSKKPVATPALVELPADSASDPRRVACGASHTVVCTNAGQVYSWGFGAAGQLGCELLNEKQPVPRLIQSLLKVPIATVAAGRSHTMMLSCTGDIYTCGSGKDGQLGHNGHQTVPIPQLVKTSDLPTAFAKPITFKAIAAGDLHSVALSTDGRVYSWGSGVYGELGHGYARSGSIGVGGAGDADLKVLRPKAIEALPLGCTTVACGSAQTSAVSKAGVLWVMGSVENYVLAANGGDESPQSAATIAAKATSQFVYTPAKVALPNKRKVQAVACGKSHVVVLDSSGDVWAVGNGGSGQLGHGKRSDVCTARPVLIGKRIASIAAGRYHTVAISAYGTAWSWGAGEQGQLGHGRARDKHIPRVMSSLLDRVVLGAACGEHHTVLVTTPPITASAGEAGGMEMWASLEEREYRLKAAIAKQSLCGLTGRDQDKVAAHKAELIAEYEAEQELKEALKNCKLGQTAAAALGGASRSEMFVDTTEQTRDRVSKAIADSANVFKSWRRKAAATGEAAGVGAKLADRQPVEPRMPVAARRPPVPRRASQRRRTLSSASSSAKAGAFASSRGGQGSPRDLSASPPDDQPDDPFAARPGSGSGKGLSPQPPKAFGLANAVAAAAASSRASSRLPAIGGASPTHAPTSKSIGAAFLAVLATTGPAAAPQSVRAATASPRPPSGSKPRSAGSARSAALTHRVSSAGSSRSNSRSAMRSAGSSDGICGKLGELQKATRVSVGQVCKLDIASDVRGLQARVMQMRESHSRLSSSRHIKQAQLDELKLQFEVDGREAADRAGEAAALAQTQHDLQIQLKAVELKHTEQLENTKLNQLQVNQLQAQLQDQVIKIQSCKEAEAEATGQLILLGGKGRQATERLVVTLHERQEFMDDVNELQGSLKSHIKHVKRLSDSTVNTLKVVTHGERQRQQVKAERKATRTKAAAAAAAIKDRQARAASAVTKLKLSKLKRLEGAFGSIIAKTGLAADSLEPAEVATMIVDRITTRPTVLADLQQQRDQCKATLDRLAASKVEAEDSLTACRATSLKENVLKQVEVEKTKLLHAGGDCERKAGLYKVRMDRLVGMTLALRSLFKKMEQTELSAQGALDEASDYGYLRRVVTADEQALREEIISNSSVLEHKLGAEVEMICANLLQLHTRVQISF